MGSGTVQITSTSWKGVSIIAMKDMCAVKRVKTNHPTQEGGGLYSSPKWKATGDSFLH